MRRWRNRLSEWLQVNPTNPLNCYLIPPLKTIVLDYSYEETLIVVATCEKDNKESFICWSLCPNIDKSWVCWENSQDLPCFYQPPVLGIGSNHSLLVASEHHEGLKILHNHMEEHSQWNELSKMMDPLLFRGIRQMRVLGDRTYFFGVKIRAPSFQSFVSTALGISEPKILTPPTYVIDATLFAIPAHVGTSFESDMDTTISGVLLLVGGYHPPYYRQARTNGVSVYNPIKDTWKPLVHNMPRPRYKLLCILIEDRVLVVGGFRNHRHVEEIDCYSLTTHTWSTFPYVLPRVPSCPATQMQVGMCYANQRIYALVPLPTVLSYRRYHCYSFEIMNPKAMWTPEFKLPCPMRHTVLGCF